MRTSPGIKFGLRSLCACVCLGWPVKGGGGSIVNVISITGRRGLVGHVTYAASKARLEGAPPVMAQDCSTHSIWVNAGAPTVTMAQLAAKAWFAPAKTARR
jgi:NAD(P)-dependent dehydrogenase (short-subunit alcohol dehydrogenase family)